MDVLSSDEPGEEYSEDYADDDPLDDIACLENLSVYRLGVAVASRLTGEYHQEP